jgi:hypothetical protein
VTRCKRRATAAMVGLVLTAGTTGCGEGHFTVSGTYLFPSRRATSDNACRGPHSAEGRRVIIEEVGPTSAKPVAQGRLAAGQLDTTTRRYGAVPVCAYPFTVPDVPSGGLSYGARVKGDGGLLFTEEEAAGVVVPGASRPSDWGCPHLRSGRCATPPLFVRSARVAT